MVAAPVGLSKSHKKAQEPLVVLRFFVAIFFR
jgi:hypothetical protein